VASVLQAVDKEVAGEVISSTYAFCRDLGEKGKGLEFIIPLAFIEQVCCKYCIRCGIKNKNKTVATILEQSASRERLKKKHCNYNVSSRSFHIGYFRSPFHEGIFIAFSLNARLCARMTV
jgi:hypothetical protein